MERYIKTNILYLRLLRPLFHFGIIVFSFYIVYNLRFYDFVQGIDTEVPYIVFYETAIFTVVSSIFFLIIGFFVWIYELYKPIHGYYRKFLKWWFFWIIIIFFFAYLWYWFIFPNWISRFVLISWWFLVLFLITVFDLIFNFINASLESKNPYKILFVYSNENFYDKIEKNFNNYNIYSIEAINYYDFTHKEKNIKENDIIITVGNFDKNFLQEISDYVRLLWKQFYHISESFFLEDLIYSPSRIWPVLAFEYKPSPLEGWYKVIKRITDIIFSLFFLIIFSWLYILIASFILIKDGKPVFYKSTRVGRWWTLFRMYKFRSMIKDADKRKNEIMQNNERWWPLFKASNDPRIPRWWKFLRKTSLDEIPQFINVLKGDMSVIGPRPHLPQEVKNYEEWQKRLLSVKPGISWYAQTFGRDSLDFEEEAKLDLYYIQNWSLFLDMYVIISTLKVVFSWR